MHPHFPLVLVIVALLMLGMNQKTGNFKAGGEPEYYGDLL